MELELTKEQFLHDVENHEMQIYKDDGIFRCITFKKENTSNLQFTITTFPNYLVITGDMGDFVFTRVEDMFNFFRGESIHKSYWAEKVVSQSKFGDGVKYFDMVLFHNNVIEYVKSYLDLNSEDSIPDEYMEEIQYILDTSDEYDAVGEIRKFSSELINFDSFFEYYSCTSFTYHYIWCCYAIQWAIKQYDNMLKN